MAMKQLALPGTQSRARWMRLSTAQILKRFHFCERSLVLSASAWLPHLASLEIKTRLPLLIWQNAESAHALRERVFELRYPSRLMEAEGADAPLVRLFDQLRGAPFPAAFVLALGSTLLPALRDAYKEYLRCSDPLADAPTHRFLALSLAEKEQQIGTVSRWAEEELSRAPANRSAAQSWNDTMAKKLTALGGVGTEHAPSAVSIEDLKGSRRLDIPAKPARDPRYWACRFYWPDNVDPAFPYGEGIRLQLRSAVSHLNEVWAIETGGIILETFASVLPWEWIRDAARWTYDEARHCQMGLERLAAWGFEPAEIPLGTYIYESASGEDPIYRLGMLFFFETRNIGRKPERIDAFQKLGDAASEHDMDFDWADETIHAGYGKRWLEVLLKACGKEATMDQIRERCGNLVNAMVLRATSEEIAALRARAEVLMAKAQNLAKSTPASEDA
jgi:uncharacterized ferritin-like protein (DUF455 family)